jgi:hypothetical protein
VSTPEQGPEPRRRGGRLGSIVPVAIGLAVAIVAAIILVPKLVDEPSDTVGDGHRATTSTSRSNNTTTSTTAAPVAFPFQPLWPFKSTDDAIQWQTSSAKSSTEAWHLDAGQTAVRFSRDFLGYSDINRVTTTDMDASGGAHIGVGYVVPATTQISTAAILHLARIGAGTDAPWEVVGTDDRDLTVTTPSYGTHVNSPVAVGGTITGVDESLHVQVRQPDFPGKLGEVSGIPAGGQNSPWQATVPFTGASNPVLTIAVSTGGHVSSVERFAVTGVRVG